MADERPFAVQALPSGRNAGDDIGLSAQAGKKLKGEPPLSVARNGAAAAKVKLRAEQYLGSRLPAGRSGRDGRFFRRSDAFGPALDRLRPAPSRQVGWTPRSEHRRAGSARPMPATSPSRKPPRVRRWSRSGCPDRRQFPPSRRHGGGLSRRAEHNCNRHRTKAAGQFTIATARIKLKHVHPSFRMKWASTLA